MVSTTVQITDDVQGKLRELAEQEHESIATIIALAVERYRRERMFERADEIYAAMTPEEWAEENAERALWDCTLMDGLEDDEYEFCVRPRCRGLHEARCGSRRSIPCGRTSKEVRAQLSSSLQIFSIVGGQDW